jgi:frataxin
MTEQEFQQRAESELRRLLDWFEENGCDADLVYGTLTVELDSGQTYLLNLHAPTRQIWLSSPVSGAWHFAFQDGGVGWIATRGGNRLGDFLVDELGRLLGRALAAP